MRPAIDAEAPIVNELPRRNRMAGKNTAHELSVKPQTAAAV